MPMYIFFREGGGWYPVEAQNDEEIMEHIKLNPGTAKVMRSNGTNDVLIWENKD